MDQRISEIKSGDSVIINIAVKENDVAVNITGWKLYCTVKRNLDDQTATIPTIVVSEHSAPLTGISAVSIDKALVSELNGTYYYDIRALKPDGTVLTIVSSTITVSPTPTPLESIS